MDSIQWQCSAALRVSNLESDANTGVGAGILLWRRIIRRVLFNGKHRRLSLVSGARLSPVFAAVTWLFSGPITDKIMTEIV